MAHEAAPKSGPMISGKAPDPTLPKIGDNGAAPAPDASHEARVV